MMWPFKSRGAGARERSSAADDLLAKLRFDEALAALRAQQGAIETRVGTPATQMRCLLSRQIAFCLIQMGRAEEALSETDRLAPGWFNSRAERWLVEQTLAGRYHKDIPRGVAFLEFFELKERASIADQLLQRFPDLPHAWLTLAECLTSMERKEDAVRGLSVGTGVRRRTGRSQPAADTARCNRSRALSR